MKLGILTGDADADALWLGRGSSCGSRLGLLAKRPVNGPSFANRIDHNKKKTNSSWLHSNDSFENNVSNDFIYYILIILNLFKIRKF